jgi:hypothetical protein
MLKTDWTEHDALSSKNAENEKTINQVNKETAYVIKLRV